MRGATAIAFALLLMNHIALAQDHCGAIGNSDESELDDEDSRQFYINAADPAPCTGYITSWRVCYYGPDDSLDEDEQRSYWATYAVYRRMGSGRNERYERVSEMFQAVRATTVPSSGSSFTNLVDSAVIDGRMQQEDFMCYSDTVDNSPLLVQAGDVIGACVFNPEDAGGSFTRSQLDVVGEAEEGSLLQMSIRSGENGCTIDKIPSNIRVNDLSRQNNKRLHIHANIIVAENPTMEFEVSTPPDTDHELPTSTMTTIATTQSDGLSPSPLTTSVPTDLTTTTNIPLVSGSPTDAQVQTDVTTVHLENSTPSRPTDNQLATTAAVDLEATTQSDDITSSPANFQETTVDFETGSSSSSLSPGATASLIIGLLLSLGLGVATVVVVAIICLVKCRRANNEKHSTVWGATRDGLSLDNPIYDTGVNKEAEAPVPTMRKAHPTGSAYAAPSVYNDYATFGPNKETQDFNSEHPERVMFITSEPPDIYNLNGVLSSPLEAEENMYRDLRERYSESDDYHTVD